MLFDVGIITNLTDAVEVDNDLNGLGGCHGPLLHAGGLLRAAGLHELQVL